MLSGNGTAAFDQSPDDAVRCAANTATPQRAGHADADTMDFACRLAVAVLPDVLWAGVTVAGGGNPFTASATDRRVTEMHQAQYDFGDGPCLRAGRHDRSISLQVDEIAVRWPALARTARSLGVGSTLAEPLHVGTAAIGSLNLYGSYPGYDLRVPYATLSVLTGCLERILGGYGADRSRLSAANLRRAIGQREVIEQARGVLMVTGGLSREEAGALLQQQAEQRHSTLVAAARTILRRHHGNNGSIGRP